TLKKKRQEQFKKDPTAYPSKEQMRAEVEEEEPAVLVTIATADGTPVRVINGPTSAGVHRVTWDMKLPAVNLPRPRAVEPDEDFFGFTPSGPYAATGKYKATVAKRVGGVVTPLAEPVEFSVKYVGPSPLPAEDQKQLAEYQKQVIRLQRDLTTATAAAGETTTRLEAIKTPLDVTPN